MEVIKSNNISVVGRSGGSVLLTVDFEYELGNVSEGVKNG